jgi:ribosomal protein S8
MVSKPSRRIELSVKELGRVVRGFRAGMVQGLVQPGECLFVLTDGEAVVEAREAVERGLGGMALCRAY